MSLRWLEQRERGTRRAMKVGIWLVTTFGHRVGRFLVYGSTLYFLASSGRARAASRAYLGRALRRPATFVDVMRHYFSFAAVMMDRVYLLTGRHAEFSVEEQGHEALEAALARGRGCLLLGAHLGSFDILRVLGTLERKLPINVLIYPEAAANANAVAAELSPELLARVIPLGRPDTLLRVAECLERGEIVGMLGDRVLKDEKSVRCDFLGTPASFPQGPLLLAAILKAPVVLFFGLYRGGKRYSIHFEGFAQELLVDRAHRAAQLQPWIERYASRLEHYCRLAPYNWFNFYDFWHA